MAQKLLIFLLLFTSTLHAGSSVWKVSSDEYSLYLGGTCHLLRPSDFPLPDEFSRAFEDAEVLILETDMAALKNPAIQMQIMMKGQLPDNKTLKDVISAQSYTALNTWAKDLGFPLFSINRLKPTLAVITLLTLEWQRMGISEVGVDQHFSDRALAEGKRMDHFETPDEQIDFMLNMAEGREDEIIAQTVQDLANLQEKFNELIDAWRRGDLIHIEEYMISEMKRDYPIIYESLLVQRNINWLPKLFTMINSPEKECVLVGAAHLAGEDGLLFLLKQAGYRVEQFRAAPKLKLRAR